MQVSMYKVELHVQILENHFEYICGLHMHAELHAKPHINIQIYLS